MSNVISSDRAWFRINKNTNVRIRRGVGDEIELIFRNALRNHVQYGETSVVPELDDVHEWRVAVLKIDANTLARIPIVRDKDWPDELKPGGDGGALATMFVGGNVLFDRIGG